MLRLLHSAHTYFCFGQHSWQVAMCMHDWLSMQLRLLLQTLHTRERMNSFFSLPSTLAGRAFIRWYTLHAYFTRNPIVTTSTSANTTRCSWSPAKSS